MPTSSSCARPARNIARVRQASLIALVAAAATLHVSAAQAPPDLEGTLTRIGSRIEELYKRIQSLMCVEKVTAQPIRTDMSFDGFARVLDTICASKPRPKAMANRPRRTSSANCAR